MRSAGKTRTLTLRDQVHLDRPQVVRSQRKVRLANGQVLAVYVSDGRKKATRQADADRQEVGASGQDCAPSQVSCDRTYIYPQSFHARLSAFERVRADVFAARLQARVICVDQPGVGAYNTLSSPSQEAAGRGNIRYHAIAALQAVNQAARIAPESEIGFLGYSLGAWTVSNMIPALISPHSPLDWSVGPVILLDPSNLMRRPIHRLAAQLFQDQRHAFEYFNDNANLGWRVPQPYFVNRSRFYQIARRDSRQLRALMGPALGMTRRTITDDYQHLEELCNVDHLGAQRVTNMRTLLVQFSGSQLCPNSHVDHFFAGIAGSRFAHSTKHLRIGAAAPKRAPVHSIMYSLPSVQQIAGAVGDFDTCVD